MANIYFVVGCVVTTRAVRYVLSVSVFSRNMLVEELYDGKQKKLISSETSHVAYPFALVRTKRLA